LIDDIIKNKKAEVEKQKEVLPWETLLVRSMEAGPVRGFHDALKGPGIKVIAEIKKASPSSGVIRNKFRPVHTAKAYQEGGARALSVLTDKKYFQGSFRDVRLVRDRTPLPMLRKDFILHPYQIDESRCAGVDCILLIARILSRRDLKYFIEYSKRVGLDCLVEVHSKEDVEKALFANAELVGINNRDLDSLQVDLETTLRLLPLIPDDVTSVSESGISGPDDVRRLSSAGVDAFLIGEYLLKQRNIVEALRGLIH
jgi:indole-3-glycerol phosphate synthase